MNDWPFDAEKPPKVFGAYLSDARLVAWEILWFISSGGGAIIVVTCELKIMNRLRSLGGGYHETTRQMHREFHRALMAMAICPLITSGIPIFFFIITICLALCPGPISAFMASGCSWITVFNPLTTIFFMRCYRDVVLTAVWKRRPRVAT
ncbi:hypothetical protein AAVH_19784 [Aphelenchoides avenae]|nr:hypothetical protein AAVH_19784 [Aphelenchus avenae]